jgi:uncharacterized protein (TIGR03435 family)
MRTLALSLLLSAAMFGQNIEAASVKASDPVRPGSKEKVQRGIRTSPGSVTAQNTPLLELLRWSYGLKDFQVDGPHWTQDQGYDILAKASGPAAEQELQAMMRDVLTQRFKLVFHREIKELPVYEMTIAKGGHKLQPSVGEGEQRFDGGGGNLMVRASQIGMAELASLISRPLQRPVVDKTGLAGKFDVTLNLTGYAPVDGANDREILVAISVQQQLGLKLEPKKAPVEMFIIDGAEKLSSQN